MIRGKLAQTMGKRQEADRLFSAAQEAIDEIAAGVSDVALRERFLREATAQIPRWA